MFDKLFAWIEKLFSYNNYDSHLVSDVEDGQNTKNWDVDVLEGDEMVDSVNHKGKIVLCLNKDYFELLLKKHNITKDVDEVVGDMYKLMCNEISGEDEAPIDVFLDNILDTVMEKYGIYIHNRSLDELDTF